MAEVLDIEGVTYKRCTKCGELQELSLYHATKRNEDGSIKSWQSWCRKCTKAHYDANKTVKTKPVPVVTETHKECLECHEMVLFKDFTPNTRGRKGLSAYCNKCHLVRRKRNKDYLKITREITSRYREKHKLRWRALHRINQFNRRSKVKATSDGSVTDEFLEMIYSTVNCCWCGKETPEEERTLEHVVELSQGGTHTSDNIKMACFSCNSSRKGKNKCDNQPSTDEVELVPQ